MSSNSRGSFLCCGLLNRATGWFPSHCWAIAFAFIPCGIGILEAQETPKKVVIPGVDPNKLYTPLLRSSQTTAAAIPLSDTFRLHSRSTATKTIYLDFDGHVTTGTAWNTGGNSIVTSPFNLDGNPSFSNSELTQIQEIWQRVAECFSPFDVDVTTAAPPLSDLINSGGTDTRWGMRVLIGTSSPSPAPGAGGVAFLNSFNYNSDTPCFVFPGSLGNLAKLISDASVHEVGHTLGLNHDGRITPAEEYYYGHGTGPTGWAPHMGVGYDRNLVQWSKGEYLSASNRREDDLVIITTRNGFGYRQDDYASDRTTAVEISGSRGSGVNATVFRVSQIGVIERTADTDWFKLTAGNGPLTLSAVGGEVNTMLDIQMDLYSSTGTLVTTSNPVNQLTASISQTVSAGVYYVKIDGVGNGDPLGTGYTDYGSLGTYTITGSFTAPPQFTSSTVIAAYSAATKTLTLTGDVNSNSLTVSLQTGSLKIEGANGTSIGVAGAGGQINKYSSTTFPHTGKLVLNADLGSGDDSLAMIGVDSSTTTVKLGIGSDKAAFTLCNIGTLNLDGGAGTDIVTTTSSTIGTFNKQNLP